MPEGDEMVRDMLRDAQIPEHRMDEALAESGRVTVDPNLLSAGEMHDLITGRETVTYLVHVTRLNRDGGELRSYMVASIDLDEEDPELLYPIVTHGDKNIAGNAHDVYDQLATSLVFRRLS